MADRVVSEDVLEKAVRLLTDGNLDVVYRVKRLNEDVVRALCFGDSGVEHRLVREKGVTTCSCPAAGICSHMLALSLVTGNPPEPTEGGTT